MKWHTDNPKENGSYIATFIWWGKTYVGEVNFENEKWKDLDGDSIEVLAWMPLPKAYKESEETK